jgi:hypothetical protein
MSPPKSAILCRVRESPASANFHLSFVMTVGFDQWTVFASRVQNLSQPT